MSQADFGIDGEFEERLWSPQSNGSAKSIPTEKRKRDTDPKPGITLLLRVKGVVVE